MVDKLKTTESISQGARAFALSQTPRIDPACIKQLSRSIITTIQASLIFLSIVFLIYREKVARLSCRLCYTYAQGRLPNLIRGSGVSFTARMADRSKQLNLSARGPRRRGAAYRKPAIDK